MEKSPWFPLNASLFLFGLLPLILFLGCAPISKELRAQADQKLGFQQVFQNPEAYKGKIVIWGGAIVETSNQKEDGTTLIVVLQSPLEWTEEPTLKSSEGRFIILVERYVDPYVFRRGKRITVAGEIQGRKVMRLGELEYPYPLLLSKQVYLWEDYYYSPYPYDPYWYSYYPKGYYGFYGPWWRYPY